MPVGLPQVSSTTEQCRIYAVQIADAWRNFLVYLDLPSTSLYWESCQAAYRDVGVACSSVGTLGFLTLKPIVLILWLVLQNVYRVTQFLARVLFAQFYVSAKKGLVQFKYASGEFIKWQSSLTNAEIGIELLAISGVIGCFLLRRHIQKRKYVQRVTSFYRRKKRHVKQAYRRGVRRIADTSLFLAMLMPHAVFLASIAATKLLFPKFLTYLAADTYLIALLSFGYPFIWTIGILQYYRNGGESIVVGEQENSKRTRGDLKTPTRPRRRRLSSSFFPRTTPTRSVQKWLRATTSPVRRNEQEEYNLDDDATYWLEYWFVYALFLALCRLTILLPIVGRILTRYARLSTFLREMQLVFFLWVFGVPLVTPELTRETRPLPLLYQRAVPVVNTIYKAVSHAIPPTFWQSVVDRASSFLDLAVMVKLVSTSTKDWIIHILEEARPVLPPAITLFMPGFLTEYGVVYVQTLVPCAKCSQVVSLAQKMQWLEYWVLHGLVSCFLTWWAPILWWIPFSTHAMFLLWCNLQLPKTTKRCYNVLEEELQAFGLLEKGEKDLQVEQTVTASVFRRLASSLPSASDAADHGTSNTDNGEAVQEHQGEQEEAKEDSDGDVVMVDDGDEDTASDEHDTANDIQVQSPKELVSDHSWSSDENVVNSNVTTRRRSVRQRKPRKAN